MANIFERELGIPLPACCSHGDCCKGASPSTPFFKLLERAAQGDEFARNFFSIMVPYASHDEARQVTPGLVERTLKAAEKSEEFKSPDDVVFYRCRYQLVNNKCGIHEDRPQFCRDYPDTPFVVMAPGCAFEGWQSACREKYQQMQAEVEKLKQLKDELAELRTLQGISTGDRGKNDTNIDDLFFSEDNTGSLSIVLSLTNLYVASPFGSFFL